MTDLKRDRADDTSARLRAAEEALAHHEAELADLSAVVARQWDELTQLRRSIDEARRRIAELEAALPGSPADTRPPPHY